MKSLLLAMTAVLLTGSVAAAGWCKPPQEPPRRDLDATICLRDDPRAEVDIFNVGNVTATAKVVYWTGRTATRRVIRTTLGAGGSRHMTLWARGKGRSVIVRDDLTGELLARVVVTRANVGEDCPAVIPA